jgi:hypothetical protein
VITAHYHLATIKNATYANADIIDLRDLLIGYNATSNLSDFVTATAEGTGTKLTIDHDGTGISN